MKVISVSNFKGGVGKTSVCRNLAQELAMRGKSVLLIDLDQQGCLSKLVPDPDAADLGDLAADELGSGEGSIYRRANSEHRTISNVLMPDYAEGGRLSLRDVIYASANPNIDVVSVSVEFTNANGVTMGNAYRLAREIAALETDGGKRYDAVLIDTRPDIDPKVSVAWIASDMILIPVEFDAYIVDTLKVEIPAIVKVCREYDVEPAVEIVPNKVRERLVITNSKTAELEDFLSQYGLADSLSGVRIHHTTEMQKADDQKRTICDYRASSRGAQEFRALADEVCKIAGVM